MQVTKRAALAALAATAMAGGVIGSGVAWATQAFTDVPPTNPFYDEIEWGAANGIVNGYPDGSFKPAGNVTRQASVAFLGRYNDSIELQQQVVTPLEGSGGSRNTQCPAGKRALSGGGRTVATNVLMTASYPVDALGLAADDPVEATGWKVIWRTDDLVSLGGPVATTMWVLCAPPLTTR